MVITVQTSSYGFSQRLGATAPMVANRGAGDTDVAQNLGWGTPVQLST